MEINFKEKILKDSNALNPRQKICFLFTKMQPEINDEKDNTNPIYKLLMTYEDIQKYSQLDDINDTLEFYFINRYEIHKILDATQEIIFINDKDDMKINFNSLFYLSSLIEENSNLVNYNYSFNLIKKINELQIMEKEKKLKKIILAKIIIVLITNYEQYDDNNENIKKYEKDIKYIKDLNYEIIKKNSIIYGEFLKENILCMKIDEIYSQIIKTLIMSKKLDNSEYIIDEISLESIHITKTIFNELINTLDKNEDYIKEYIISEYKDLFNIKIMTFYYIFLKKILKSNIYIYKIPFLLETRNNIKTLIRDNLEKFYSSIKNIIIQSKHVIEYVLRAFNLYFNKSKIIIQDTIISNNTVQSSQNLNNNDNNDGIFCQSSFLKEKEKSGRSIGIYEEIKTEYEELWEKCEKEIAFKILQQSDFNFIINKNEKYFNCNEITIKDYNAKINYEEIKKIFTKNHILNKNYKKFISILNDFENKIENDCKYTLEFKISLQFNMENVINSIIVITCNYYLEISPEDTFHYKDENILERGLSEGFQYLINELNNYCED